MSAVYDTMDKESEMKTILLVFGTRPEAVKLCPLIHELRKRPGFRTLVCVTGQHRQMLHPVLHSFGVKPDYDLALMQDGQTLDDITTAVLERLKPVLEQVKPDLLLVQGDTTSAFAAALAAFYRRIPVGHVEAGLRTYNMDAPYPEEFNRQSISVMAKLHFAPTQTAADNLLREGRDPDGVFVTGNTVIDALQTTVSPDYRHPLLDWAEGSRLVLLTAHRRESWGAPLRGMLRAIRRAVEEHPNVKLLYPVHKNPAIRQLAEEELGGCERIRLTEPLDIPDFHNIMARACLILTDSGGIQEEAPALGKPVLVLRDTTERPEGVAAGTLRLAGTGEDNVYREFCRLLEDEALRETMSRAVNPYGDGRASVRIADILQTGSTKI